MGSRSRAAGAMLMTPSNTNRANQVNELLQASLAPFACEKLGRHGRRPGTSLAGSMASQSRGERVCAFMNYSTGMLATRFNQFDQSRKGALNGVELERFLQDLGVPLSSAQVSRFAEGVNAKRIEGSGTEGRVTLKEFINNRAALLTADAWSLPQQGRRTQSGRSQSQASYTRSMAGSRISHIGTPPRRVANATFSGSNSDLKLGQTLLKNVTGVIMCPGVAETSWRHYQNLTRGKDRQKPNEKVFPECLPTHSMADSVTETTAIYIRYSDDALKRRKPFYYKATIPL